MKKKLRGVLLLFLLGISVMILFTGCGKRDEALDEYKENMESYFNVVADIDYQMNSIEITEGLSPEEMTSQYMYMLNCLDRLDAATTEMAQYDVPEQFSLTETLADEAADNLKSATDLFHQVLESETFDQGIADAALEYYSRANKRIGYIRSILQGDIPSELTIEYDTAG